MLQSSSSSIQPTGIESASSAPSRRSVETFLAAADALWPRTEVSGAPVPAASELGAAERFAELYGRLPSDEARRDLRLVLKLLDSRVGGFGLHGTARRLSEMDGSERALAMERMARSSLPPTRQAFKALKLLTGIIAATSGPGSPVWSAMGYPGPDGPAPDVPKPIVPVEINKPTQWTADVVIIGSGAGGGVAAGVLAQAGLDVVVVEAGGYFNESDFTHEEAQSTRDLFLDGALSATADAGVGLLAGSALGGGTLINYTTSFATPDRIRDEWDDVAGFDGVFTGDSYTAASQAVHARLGINRDHNTVPGREALLEKGLSNLGWHVDRMPRNVVGCPENGCGYCTMGCRHGARQCTTTTYLQDAFDAGARIVVNADARRVTTANGQATGVECVVAGQPLTIRSRTVVVAAGALNTPAVLLRSGLGGPAVGHFLRLHPVTALWGVHDEPVDPWSGTMQAIYSDQFEDVDGKGHGFKFETAPVHPLFPSVFLGWSSAAQYQRDVLELRSLQPIGILLRDRVPGRVTVRKNGTPVWHYRVSKVDQANVRVGLQRAYQVLVASGAREIMSSSQPPVRMRADTDTSTLMAEMDRVGYGPNETVYVSFHQMGSARMGSNPRLSVVGSSNELHDTKGVYVMDGSCFPTASGVNPMTTIQTIAHRAAQMLAHSLTA